MISYELNVVKFKLFCFSNCFLIMEKNKSVFEYCGRNKITSSQTITSSTGVEGNGDFCQYFCTILIIKSRVKRPNSRLQVNRRSSSFFSAPNFGQQRKKEFALNPHSVFSFSSGFFFFIFEGCMMLLYNSPYQVKYVVYIVVLVAAENKVLSYHFFFKQPLLIFSNNTHTFTHKFIS